MRAIHRSRSFGLALILASAPGVAVAEPAVAGVQGADSPTNFLISYAESAVAGLSGCTLTEAAHCALGVDSRSPLRATIAMPGALFHQGIEAQVASRLSVAAAGFSGSLIRDPSSPLGFVAGARLSLLDDGVTRLSLSVGGVRDQLGVGGAWYRADAVIDIGRLRLSGIVHAQHTLAPGSDTLDVAMLAGASYSVAGPLRLGAECLAQDMEAVTGIDLEGGSSERCGPSVSFEPSDRQLAVVLGTSSGIGNAAHSTSTRAALSYSF